MRQNGRRNKCSCSNANSVSKIPWCPETNTRREGSIYVVPLLMTIVACYQGYFFITSAYGGFLMFKCGGAGWGGAAEQSTVIGVSH